MTAATATTSSLRHTVAVRLTSAAMGIAALIGGAVFGLAVADQPAAEAAVPAPVAACVILCGNASGTGVMGDVSGAPATLVPGQ